MRINRIRLFFSKLPKWIASVAAIGLLVGLASAAPAPDDIAFTVHADSLDYPFASAEDNQAALGLMLAHASVVGHYYKSGMYVAGAGCGRFSECHLFPHLAEGKKDHSVKAKVGMTTTDHGKSWRLDFKLPEQHGGAELALVTLVVPLDGLWQQPSVQKAIAKATAALPDYEKYSDAQKQGQTVSIDLIVPGAMNQPGPFLYYCPVIQNPMSWSHSGALRMQVLAQGTSGKLRSEGGMLLERVANDGQCMHPSIKPTKNDFYRTEHE